MRVCTIDDGCGDAVRIGPGDMFHDTRRSYVRILHVDRIVTEHAPVYLADCSIYVRFPAGMLGRPKPVRLLVADLASPPYVRVQPDESDALWVHELRNAEPLDREKAHR